MPRKVDYELADILKDLLNFAARYLKVGGRLVYWLPVYRPEYAFFFYISRILVILLPLLSILEIVIDNIIQLNCFAHLDVYTYNA